MSSSFDSVEVESFLEENIGKIFFGMGLLLSFVGVLLLSSFTSLTSILALFFGITFILTGLLAQVGIVTSNSSRRQKIGATLIIASLFMFSSACVSIAYTQIGAHEIIPTGEDEFQIRIKLAHPLVWLLGTLFLIGISLFIIGFIIKYRL